MTAEARTLDIADHGRSCHMDHAGLMAYHGGGAVFGATVAYRALQLASRLLSDHGLWDRESLAIISRHPGPGVRDAIEFVTRCVTRNRYEVDSSTVTEGCGSGMHFQWQVRDGRRVISVELLEDFVPERLFELAERTRARIETSAERQRESPDSLFKFRWLDVASERERTHA